MENSCDGVSIVSGVNIFDLVSSYIGNEAKRSDIQPLAIPNYQREYCWRKKQVEGLMSSIWKFQDYGDGRLHLGTIVVHEREKDGQAKFWDVVDGQQRAITLSILYKLYKYKDDVSFDFPLLNVVVDNNAIPHSMVRHVYWAAKAIKLWIDNHSRLSRPVIG